MSAVTLDDTTIRLMLANSSFTVAFPFLRTMTKTITSGCGCGQGGKKRKQVPDFDGIRRAVVALSVEDKKKLKKLFGGAQVSVKYRRLSDRQLVKVQF